MVLGPGPGSAFDPGPSPGPSPNPLGKLELLDWSSAGRGGGGGRPGRVAGRLDKGRAKPVQQKTTTFI